MNEKTRRAARRLLPPLLLLLAAAPAAAQAEGNPPHWCRNGAFPSDSSRFVLGWVKGRRGERVYFHKDDEGCPGRAAKCRGRAYVIPGDEVIVSRTLGRWACSWYQPEKGPETVGWLDLNNLDVSEEPSSPVPARFVGEWTFYENTLNIRAKNEFLLAVDGQAFWRGLGDNVHVGEVAGEATTFRNALTVEEDACRVTAHVVGPYLVVRDNKQCGGANVTFDGVYRKRPERRRPAS